MDDRLERGWKWVLRGLGVLGFLYLLTFKPDVPVAFYVLLSGLLGLPNVIAYQLRMNRQAKREDEPAPPDDSDPDDAHKSKHGYVP